MDKKFKRQKTLNPKLKQDRLSNLPDELLIQILSLLPMKLAVSTTVLSQRWKNLWTQITSVTIDCRDFQDPSSFYSIVDSFISKLNSPLIRHFNFHLDDSVEVPSAVVDSWFQKICSRNVESFKVNVVLIDGYKHYKNLGLNPPTHVFQTKSLVQLDLMNRYDYEIPDIEFNLPHLKSLQLFYYYSQHWTVSKLIRSCPSLESLNLLGRLHLNERNADVTIDITNSNLKKLFMCHRKRAKFAINAPNLRHLDFKAGGGWFCSSTRALSVRTAIVKLTNKFLALLLFLRILSVQYLNIDHVTLGVLKCLDKDKEREALQFRNLERLSLDLRDRTSVDDELSWNPTDSVPAGVLNRVKSIKIRLSKISNENEDCLLNLTKSLLMRAPNLEELTFIVSFEAREWKKAEGILETKFYLDVVKCAHTCSQCLIYFYGKYIHVSADVIKVRRADGKRRTCDSGSLLQEEWKDMC